MAAVTSTEQAGQGGGGPAARQRALPAGKCPSKAEAVGQCARAAGRAAGRRSRISYCCSSAGHGGARARRDAQAPPGGRHGPRHVTRLHPKGHEKRQNQNQRSPSLLSYGPLRAASGRSSSCSGPAVLLQQRPGKEKGHAAPRVSPAAGASRLPPRHKAECSGNGRQPRLRNQSTRV